MAPRVGTQINRERTTTTSQYRGVGWYRRSNRWQASIWTQGKLHHLGYFDDEVEAAKAYDKAAREVYGPMAVLNFPITQPITRPDRPVTAKTRVRRRFSRFSRPQKTPAAKIRYDQQVAPKQQSPDGRCG